MSKVSFIIPSRNERFMPQTVEDIFKKATGDFEVIVVLDGYWPEEMPKERTNLIFLHRGKSRGMRAALNDAAAIAKGEYLLKMDAHVMIDEGFDEKMQADYYEDNWVLIARRYSLDPLLWTTRDKSPIDYHYLDCPLTNPDYFQFHGVVWKEMDRAWPQLKLDEEMSFQGSLWFMSKEHFHKRLEGLSEEGYGSFSQEPQEIGMKTWLGGGKVMVTKNTWYAHLHKGKQFGRMYSIGKKEVIEGHIYSANYWMRNRWEKRIHDMEWLVDRFWPVPTWPNDWQSLPLIHGQGTR